MIKITIEKIEEITVVRREYNRIADTGNDRDGGPVYDYTTTEAESTKTTKLYEQMIEDKNFNLYNVIKAANELGQIK